MEMSELVIVGVLEMVAFVMQLRIRDSQLLVPLFKSLAVDMLGDT